MRPRTEPPEPGAADGGRADFVVPADDDGARLDRFLSAALPDRTRSTLRRWIDEGRVWVDGGPAAKAGLPLRRGSTVVVNVPAPPAPRPEPERLPVSVLHEDDHLVVVDKPAGMVVHPGHGNRSGTLVNALLGRGTALSATGGPERPGIVHRLDRGTSGLLVVAKSDAAHRALAAAFARRDVEKTYVALVWGHPDPSRGRIEGTIGRSRANPVKMAVGGRSGKPAASAYRESERLPGFSLLDVFPESGRTHQIRVHLQSIHHPIVGDDRYGGRAWRGVRDRRKRRALAAFDRLALHAAALELDHPATGKRLRFRAPLPDDFERLLAVLREP